MIKIVNKKFKTNLFLVVMLSISGFTKGQFSVKIVNENFESNALRWDIRKDENSELDIAGGKYLMVNKTEGTALTSTIDIDHINEKNFKISATITKTKGIDNNGFGLIWGGSDINNEYEFVISGSGYYKVLKWEQGQKEDLIPWTYSAAISRWDFGKNKLLIEFAPGIIRYFINDTYIAATPDSKPFSIKAGFVVNENMDIEIEDFTVENITDIHAGDNLPEVQNIEISKLEFSGNQSNVLNYNETATIGVDIKNNNNFAVKDVIISILPSEQTNGILYSPILMVNELMPGEIKTIAVQLAANEEINTQDISFTINIQNVKKSIIDSESIQVQLKGKSNYIDPNDDFSITDSDENNQEYNPGTANSDDFCTNGCITSGLISILTGIIVAIFE